MQSEPRSHPSWGTPTPNLCTSDTFVFTELSLAVPSLYTSAYNHAQVLSAECVSIFYTKDIAIIYIKQSSVSFLVNQSVLMG